MKKYKEITTVGPEVIEIVCDKCGLIASKEQFSYGGLPMHTIEISGGFNSIWPGDLTTVEGDFCEQCLEELLGEYLNLKKKTR